MTVVNVLRLPAPAARAPRPSWFTRLRARRDADRFLRASRGSWESHPAFAWRVAELTSPRERRSLARSLRGIVKDAASPSWTFSASPLNRRGLRPYVDDLARLACRIGDLEQSVTGAGIVLVRDLITDGGSPLYIAGDVRALPATLARIRATLNSGYPVAHSDGGTNDSSVGVSDPFTSMKGPVGV